VSNCPFITPIWGQQYYIPHNPSFSRRRPVLRLVRRSFAFSEASAKEKAKAEAFSEAGHGDAPCHSRERGNPVVSPPIYSAGFHAIRNTHRAIRVSLAVAACPVGHGNVPYLSSIRYSSVILILNQASFHIFFDFSYRF